MSLGEVTVTVGCGRESRRAAREIRPDGDQASISLSVLMLADDDGTR